MELRARGAAADVHILRGLQKELGAFHLLELRTQPRDDLKGRDVAFVLRLQGDVHAAIVDRGRRAAGADGHGDGGDRGVGGDDLA